QEDAEHWATRTEELVAGQRWDLLEVARARGIAALAAHDSARATAELLGVWKHTETEGIEEPGVFPVAPDLVEAALGIGDIACARDVTARLTELAHRQEHPWGLASVRRCDGLLELATDGDGEQARLDLLAAADRYGSLGLQFDEARTLLGLGRHMRRGRKWAVARAALERAAATFDELGCDGWAGQARDELSSVGGRRPRDAATLTPTERRVVELASRGSSNKEIAQTLFVTVHTVEVHLSHAYAKLGVRSRAQLSGRLAASG
nr:helix-turn-helix transcriptional regulator [Actinomycetota bacterium]